MTAIRISRDTHIRAPDGAAVYAYASYAEPHGTRLLETVRHEGLAFTPAGRQYYPAKVYRRTSDDHGRTWNDGDLILEASLGTHVGTSLFPHRPVLHAGRGILVDFHASYDVDPAQPMFGIGNLRQRTYRSFYRLSHDGGRSWSAAVQIIDERPDYDETLWAPGVRHGHTGATPDGLAVFLPDGSFVQGFTRYHPEAPAENTCDMAKEVHVSVIYGRARFSEDGLRLHWRFGEEISVPFPLSAIGACEPTALSLGGLKLCNTMRCQGDPKHGFYSSRQMTVSEDGGMTWSAPEPLRYDDGGQVWTPASLHGFFVSSKTGRAYLLANLLDAPVYGQCPRYPLCIAEFDRAQCRVLRTTRQVIQDLPPGAPTDRRYTNWGQYEERRTGDLILLMPEQPKRMNYAEMRKPEDMTSDCVRFRIAFE